MLTWIETLSPLERGLFYVALFATLVFALQTLLTFLGLGDGADGVDTDGDWNGSQGHQLSPGDLFTIRNGVAFLMGLGWGGLMVYEWGITQPFLVVGGGIVVGLVWVALNMGIFFLLSLIRHEGNVKIRNALGQPGTVTLRVPAHRTGIGKVRVSVQGRLLEFHAVSDGPAAIARNAAVTVVDVTGDQLVVSRAARPETS